MSEKAVGVKRERALRTAHAHTRTIQMAQPVVRSATPAAASARQHLAAALQQRVEKRLRQRGEAAEAAAAERGVVQHRGRRLARLDEEALVEKKTDERRGRGAPARGRRIRRRRRRGRPGAPARPHEGVHEPLRESDGRNCQRC